MPDVVKIGQERPEFFIGSENARLSHLLDIPNWENAFEAHLLCNLVGRLPHADEGTGLTNASQALRMQPHSAWNADGPLDPEATAAAWKAADTARLLAPHLRESQNARAATSSLNSRPAGEARD